MSGDLPIIQNLGTRIFNVQNEKDFEEATLAVYRWQYAQNPVYQQFSQLLHRSPENVAALSDIPFLPISFFKTHPVVCGSFSPEVIFESSGTTGSVNSRHLVKDVSLYETAFTTCFEQFYGKATDYCILALLPSYLERGQSSLVYMAESLMQQSRHPQNGFYLHDHQALAGALRELEAKGQKTLLLGVTYALLDFAAAYPMPLKNTIIMETGGMKGRKKELVRSEVHEILKEAFKLKNIHSEYGMTELLSQAYAVKDGVFSCPPWMRMLIREEDDPQSLILSTSGMQTGVINIIDLANLYSCSFIATDDVGRLHPDSSFEVMGRLDNSDIRGCSLLAL